MKRILMTLAQVAAYPLIAAGSCQTMSEPPRVLEVKVPVVQPCPDGRSKAPDYPDTRAAVSAALEAGDMERVTQLLLAGWPLHWQRHAEDDAQITACAAPPATAPAPGP